ncbi:interleukin-1 receptor-associated kinase 1-binding protein 1 isoform X2 [Molothrus aeneus]|uniref:interleukin-1 receptor-associated kinase 1-binding protein 1 isoform X2 n=1 Tax=Molothrus aeneus TaxID=84833 RepID=UPI0034587704
MAPPAPPPSRVFAELDLAPSPAPEGRVEPAALPGREVHVNGSAELSARPDRARVSLRLGSRKEAAVAARSSVSRRLQYIAHTARLHGIPEENMTVTEDFSRVENTYQMEAEVCIIFSDFGKMQNVCNLLIEKLGTSVTINPPHFYHTPEAIDTLRNGQSTHTSAFQDKVSLGMRKRTLLQITAVGKGSLTTFLLFGCARQSPFRTTEI